MLQSLKLDATSSSKAKDRTEDANGTAAASSDAGTSGFSGILAALAGSFQVAPGLSNLPTASAPENSRAAEGAGRAASRDWNRTSSKDARGVSNDARSSASTRQTAQKQGGAAASQDASPAVKSPSQGSSPASTRNAQAQGADPKATSQGAGSEGAEPPSAEDIQAMAQVQQPQEVAGDVSGDASGAASAPAPAGAAQAPNVASASKEAPSDSLGGVLTKGIKAAPDLANTQSDPSGANSDLNAGSKGASGADSASDSAFTLSTNPAAEAPGQDANALVISTDPEKSNIAGNTLSTMLAQSSTATVKNDPLAAEVLGGKDALGALDGSQTAQTAKAPLSHGVDAATGTARAQTAAAQAPAQASPVRTSPALAQVEGTIRWMVRNQEKSAELQLHPENLGRVTISLKVEGNEVHARVWASESSSAALLNDQRTALEQSLKDQGLNLASFDLQSGNRGEDAQRQTPMPQTKPSEPVREVSQSGQDAPTGVTPNLSNACQIEVFA